MRSLYIFAVSVLLSLPLLSQEDDLSEITQEELFEHIQFLADDALKGREPGTPGGKVAAEYIRDRIRDLGLELLGDEGFQYFNVTKGVKAGDNNSFSFGEFKGELRKDFVPLSFSASKRLIAKAVFAGYGLDVDEIGKKWMDYEGIDVKDKWAVILLGDPEYKKRKIPVKQLLVIGPESVWIEFAG